MRYVELAINNVANRNIVVEYSAINKYLKPNVPLFRSFYLYDEEIFEHFRNNHKTPQGYIGKFYVKNIILDYDNNKNNPKIMFEEVKDLVNYLIKRMKLENNYRVFFSGSGFHIHIPNIFEFEFNKDTPDVVKATIQEYFKDYKLDLSIYNRRSLIRVPFSYNEKTNLYKVYISEDELWTKDIDYIINKAKNFNIEYVPPFDNNYEKYVPVNVTKEKNIVLPTIEPTNIVTCMQKLFREGEKIGTRHIRVLRLASWLMRNGIPIEGAIAMLRAYTPSLDEYELKRTVLNVYEKKYMYGCDDEVMKEFCDSRCIFFNKKNYLPDVFGTEQLEKHYQRFVNSDVLENAINLKWFFDIQEDFYLVPGNLVGLIGDTGVNKSALMQNFCLKFKKYGNVLYVNTEMSNIELFERFMMIAHNKTREEIREYYKTNTNNLGNVISHIYYTNVTPTFDGLRELIVKFRPAIVVIDVIDDIFTKNFTLKDEEYMYMELKNIARIYNCVIFMVHHISKSAKGTQLTKHSAKGSSAFEQKCDVVLGLEGINTEKERVLKVLKGRSYPPFAINLTVDEKYRFNELINK